MNNKDNFANAISSLELDSIIVKEVNESEKAIEEGKDQGVSAEEFKRKMAEVLGRKS